MMKRRFKFEWLIRSWCIGTIFDLAESSFIHILPSNNRSHDFPFILGAGCRGSYRSILPSIFSANKKTRTRVASTGASSLYGKITSPSYADSDENDYVEIPIIGPLLNVQKPVIIGDSIWLDPPTPLQWKTIETAVEAQYRGSSEITKSEPKLATTHISPLVAILHSGAKDYATVVAVEGIVTKKDGLIDTTDSESFRESLASLSSPYYSESSRIRLLAVGRAKLTHYTTKFLNGNVDTETVEYDGKGKWSDNNDSLTSEPILVARMELLLDSNEEGKKAISPVHALNRLSTFAQRVRFLQSDRQRIVKGLQAAQSKLEMAMDEWEDWDGIGSINTHLHKSSPMIHRDDIDNDVLLNQFIQKYDRIESEVYPVPMHSLPLSLGAARCAELDNYGLGTTSSAYVSLESLANVFTEKLEKYYSPVRVKSEEFQYEVFSWCALQSLQTYLSSDEIHEVLYECLSTCDRLELLYQAMTRHKVDLTELAHAKTMELRNCGEECDLF